MADITVVCSPDADDRFMMRAIEDGSIDLGGHTFTVSTRHTDALNQLAAGEHAPEVCAISIGYYPRIAHRYQLLPHGGSVGDGYGPVVVAKEPLTLEQLRGKRVGVPGLSTTAWLVLRLMVDVEPSVVPIVPYARIFEAIDKGEVDAGLIIHEGRLNYTDHGLHKVVDLGEWWAAQTGGMPLPLGGNAIRRDLGPETIASVSAVLRESIAHALRNRDENIRWILEQGSALKDPAAVSEYLDMYANHRTLDYGADAVAAIGELLRRGAAAGLLPEAPVDLAP